MNQLPSCIVLLIILHLFLAAVESSNVLVEGLHKDDSHHAGQENHHHQRVDDRVPVDALVRLDKVSVPTGVPGHFRVLNPLNRVRVRNFSVLALN